MKSIERYKRVLALGQKARDIGVAGKGHIDYAVINREWKQARRQLKEDHSKATDAFVRIKYANKSENKEDEADAMLSSLNLFFEAASEFPGALSGKWGNDLGCDDLFRAGQKNVQKAFGRAADNTLIKQQIEKVLTEPGGIDDAAGIAFLFKQGFLNEHQVRAIGQQSFNPETKKWIALATGVPGIISSLEPPEISDDLSNCMKDFSVVSIPDASAEEKRVRTSLERRAAALGIPKNDVRRLGKALDRLSVVGEVSNS